MADFCGQRFVVGCCIISRPAMKKKPYWFDPKNMCPKTRSDTCVTYMYFTGAPVHAEFEFSIVFCIATVLQRHVPSWHMIAMTEGRLSCTKFMQFSQGFPHFAQYWANICYKTISSRSHQLYIFGRGSPIWDEVIVNFHFLNGVLNFGLNIATHL